MDLEKFESGRATPPDRADLISILDDDGNAREETALTPDELQHLYRMMVLNRMLDERMITLQRQGRIGFYIGSIGEEAAILGSAFALEPHDWFFPCYRENGGAILRGLPFQRYVDNMFGNANDPVKGRQMPNHWAWREGRVASVSSPIATQIPHAVGAAYAAKLRGERNAAIVYFGDGATSASDFHVGMNFAGVWKAPVVFLCRNNQWAISVPRERQTASKTIAIKARAYGMPGVRVDGNDLLAVYKVTREALDRARSGGGPTLIEADTYRLEGHSTSDDPRAYRDEAEVAEWRPKDPISRLRAYLASHKLWNDDEEKEYRRDVEAQIRSAVRAAEDAPRPDLDTMFDEVYARRPWHLEEQRRAVLSAK